MEHAVKRNVCYKGGGTTELQQAKILTDYGVRADPEKIGSFERLAQYVGEGRGIIIEVNAGVLWKDSNYFERGQANHAIVVTSVAKDTRTGQIQGFFINDSGRGSQDSGRFIDVKTMQNAWLTTRAGSKGVVRSRL